MAAAAAVHSASGLCDVQVVEVISYTKLSRTVSCMHRGSYTQVPLFTSSSASKLRVMLQYYNVS
jgi:hypothetical protein